MKHKLSYAVKYSLVKDCYRLLYPSANTGLYYCEALYKTDCAGSSLGRDKNNN